MKKVLLWAAVIIGSIVALPIAGLALFFSTLFVMNLPSMIPFIGSSTQKLCDDSVVIKSYARTLSITPSYFIEAQYVNQGVTETVFTIGAYGYENSRVLPINTQIPVIAVTPPVRADNYGISVLVDPKKVSAEAFSAVGNCLKANPKAMDKLIARTPDFNRVVYGEDGIQHFIGLAYTTDSDLLHFVQSINTDPPIHVVDDTYNPPMVTGWGQIFYNGYIYGDIFKGIVTKEEFIKANEGGGSSYSEFILHKNSRGENIYEYVARLQAEIRAIK